MPFGLLLDWAYATFTVNMDQEQRQQFDAQLDSIRDADKYAEEAKRQRRELARLNAHRV